MSKEKKDEPVKSKRLEERRKKISPEVKARVKKSFEIIDKIYNTEKNITQMPKIEQNRTRDGKKAMYNAMVKSLGVVTLALKDTGCKRTTFYAWLKEDEAYRALIESIGDITLDFVESKLHKLIEKGDTASTIFYLKTKGKKRGYIERSEVDVNVKKIGKDLAESESYE